MFTTLKTNNKEAQEMFELTVTDGQDYLTDYIDINLLNGLKEWQKASLLSRIVDSIDSTNKEIQELLDNGQEISTSYIDNDGMFDSETIYTSEELQEAQCKLHDLETTKKELINSFKTI